MQTALSWLLEKLAEEGRHDLVSQYLEKNRQYQQYRTALAREKRSTRPMETTECRPMSDDDWDEGWTQFLRDQEG